MWTILMIMSVADQEKHATDHLSTVVSVWKQATETYTRQL